MTVAAKRDPYREGLALAAANRHAEAIERYEEALSAKPDDAAVLFALGNTAQALGLSGPAENFFRRVLALKPDQLEAVVNLANLLRAAGQLASAEALVAPALARNSAAPELWLTMGSIHREQGDLDKAAAHYRQALVLLPDYVPALANLADILADHEAYDDAFALYDRAAEIDPQNAQVKLNRAILHFLRGRLKDGWRDYDARRKLAGTVVEHCLPRWKGRSLRHSRLLVTAEQGIGDQIMFASVIPELSQRAATDGGSVLLECEPRLAPLFQRSFPTVKVYPSCLEKRGAVTTAHYGWLKDAGGAHVAIEIGSLPRLLRESLARFPDPNRYLVPDADEMRYWRQSLGVDRAIGVCWRSGKSGGGRAVQYAPLEAWAAFLRDVKGMIVCAQYDATDEEIAALKSMSGRDILVPQQLDQRRELDRVCALLAAVDAVVSAPTAVSWLSAAVGTPTYKVLYDTSWTSFGCAREPFAPACEVLMPKDRGDWSNVFALASAKLRAHFA